jgi:hypothetical protein
MGAYGYLVFTHRPTSESRARYINVCRLYETEFDPLDESYLVDRSMLMVTFWPLNTKSKPVKSDRNCDLLIDQYDYHIANEITSAVQELDSDGPLLVAWSVPYVTGMQRGDALVLNMSRYADTDIDRAFRIWKSQISKGPEGWHDGLFTKNALEKIRNLFQQNGQAIGDAVKTFSLK